MKKTLFLLLIFSLFCYSGNAQNQTTIGIVRIEGEVHFSKAGKGDFTQCTQNTVFSSGDIIKTGTESSITIAFDNEELNIIKINERTKVIVRIIDSEKIEIIDGEMFALLKGLDEDEEFEVRTPSVVCGARGTGWLIKVREKQTEIKVFDNEVYSFGINFDGTMMKKRVWTERGFKRTIEKGKAPGKKNKMTDEELLEIENQVKGTIDIKEMLKKRELRNKIKNEKRIDVHENKLGRMDHLMNQPMSPPVIPLPGRDEDDDKKS